MQLKDRLKILFVSSEVSPFAKTGGLADVAGSLPQSLMALGNDVRVVMPRYKIIDCGMNYVTDFGVQMGDRRETCIVRELDTIEKDENVKTQVPVYFLDSYQYFDRNGIYCFSDDGDRYAFFCNSVLEMLPHINFQPDIIHCNDWHTGPICMLLKEKYKDKEFYKKIATIFTIHNLEYQGHFSKEILKLFNMSDDVFVPEKVEFYGQFNFVKAGLVYTDIINTVSELYAEEIQTAQYGERLEGLLKSRSSDLFGIVNGISYEEFDPERDPRIYKNFNEKSLYLKIENKHALQHEIGLPERETPVLGLITRLAGQKGLDLIIDKMDEIIKNDVQLIVLGIGDPFYEKAFKDAQKKYPQNVAACIEFNAPLAQRIYAGSDIFLMPSRFEPCGLGQIISLRYGTIPVVRATGGLGETIRDYDADKKHGNGFSFTKFSSDEFFKTLKRALKLYKETPDEWKCLVKKALLEDFSWTRPAQKYMNLYNMAMNKI